MAAVGASDCSSNVTAYSSKGIKLDVLSDTHLDELTGASVTFYRCEKEYKDSRVIYSPQFAIVEPTSFNRVLVGNSYAYSLQVLHFHGGVISTAKKIFALMRGFRAMDPTVCALQHSEVEYKLLSDALTGGCQIANWVKQGALCALPPESGVTIIVPKEKAPVFEEIVSKRMSFMKAYYSIPKSYEKEKKKRQRATKRACSDCRRHRGQAMLLVAANFVYISSDTHKKLRLTTNLEPRTLGSEFLDSKSTLSPVPGASDCCLAENVSPPNPGSKSSPSSNFNAGCTSASVEAVARGLNKRKLRQFFSMAIILTWNLISGAVVSGAKSTTAAVAGGESGDVLGGSCSAGAKLSVDAAGQASDEAGLIQLNSSKARIPSNPAPALLRVHASGSPDACQRFLNNLQMWMPTPGHGTNFRNFIRLNFCHPRAVVGITIPGCYESGQYANKYRVAYKLLRNVIARRLKLH